MGNDGLAVETGKRPEEASPDDPDPGAIAARIRERAARIERRERERALRKLDDCGGLTDAQREAVADLTGGIVEGLLATPETALAEADPGELRAAMRVYGLDPPDSGGGDGGEGRPGDRD